MWGDGVEVEGDSDTRSNNVTNRLKLSDQTASRLSKKLPDFAQSVTEGDFLLLTCEVDVNTKAHSLSWYSHFFSFKMLINWNTVTTRVAYAVANQLYYCVAKRSKECCESKSSLFKKSLCHLANTRIAIISSRATPGFSVFGRRVLSIIAADRKLVSYSRSNNYNAIVTFNWSDY